MLKNKVQIQKTIDPHNEYTVFNRFLAAFLVLCNVRMTNVAQDKKDFSRDVFYFKKGSKLSKALNLYNFNKYDLQIFVKKINETLIASKERDNKDDT